MQTLQNTDTLLAKDGTRFEITTVKFEPVTAYLLLAKIGRLLVPAVLASTRGAAGDMDAVFDQLTPELAQAALVDSLASTSVVRPDDNGKLEKIDLVNIREINRAFRGGYLREMMLAMKHSLAFNYQDLFVASAGPDAASATTPAPSP
jgi:hypothetical protein